MHYFFSKSVATENSVEISEKCKNEHQNVRLEMAGMGHNGNNQYVIAFARALSYFL
jgi:hypothetical protein